VFGVQRLVSAQLTTCGALRSTRYTHQHSLAKNKQKLPQFGAWATLYYKYHQPKQVRARTIWGKIMLTVLGTPLVGMCFSVGHGHVMVPQKLSSVYAHSKRGEATFLLLVLLLDRWPSRSKLSLFFTSFLNSSDSSVLLHSFQFRPKIVYKLASNIEIQSSWPLPIPKVSRT
jgi:hypothetical protein